MIRVSLVLMAGLAVSAALRKQSAALKHWVLAATIVCAALTPALSAVVPEWPLRLSWPRFGQSAASITLFIPVHLTPSDAPSAAGTDVAGAAGSFAPMRILAWVWTAGTIAGLAILAMGLFRLTWIARRARPLDDGKWTAAARVVSRRYGLSRSALLLESDHPTLLATWGLGRPKVILPRHARRWPDDRVRIVLGHELAHAARRDWLVQMAGEVLRCVYWFNPLVWIVCRRLRQESEQACDDAVLQLGVEGSDYATHLLEVARAFAPHRTILFPAPAMARPSSLERRVRAMLNDHLNRAPISRAAAIAIAVAIVTVTTAIAGVVTSAQTANASFSGRLVDAIGKILPDTTVILSSAQNQQTLKTTSDSYGQFTFASVPAGDYQLQSERPGFASAQGRVTLTAGQRLTRDVVLQVGGLEETISLSARAGETPPESSVHRPALVPVDAEFDPCSQSPVGGCITQPTKLRDVKPIYPASKSVAGIGGLVVLTARIGTDGFMKDFRVVSGDADFANATIAACHDWQFSQTRLDGVPVEVDMKVTARYTIVQ
jgi:beta-lactamase regulating signal transducer with metallopeptidase domain